MLCVFAIAIDSIGSLLRTLTMRYIGKRTGMYSVTCLPDMIEPGDKLWLMTPLSVDLIAIIIFIASTCSRVERVEYTEYIGDGVSERKLNNTVVRLHYTVGRI